MPCARDPAVMVNGAVTKHLEVLGCMPVLSFRIIKSINHRRSVKRKLLGAVHHLRKRQTRSLKHSRCNIYYVAKLWADLTFSFDSFGPMHYHAVAGAAPMRSNLLGPLERSIQSMRPANRIVRESMWTSPVIDMVHHLGCITINAIQRHHLIVSPFGSSFGTGSVIAYNINKQGVIQFTHVAQCLNQSSDFIIGLFGKAGEYFHLSRQEFFLIGIHTIPCRNFVWARC